MFQEFSRKSLGAHKNVSPGPAVALDEPGLRHRVNEVLRTTVHSV